MSGSVGLAGSAISIRIASESVQTYSSPTWRQLGNVATLAPHIRLVTCCSLSVTSAGSNPRWHKHISCVQPIQYAFSRKDLHLVLDETYPISSLVEPSERFSIFNTHLQIVNPTTYSRLLFWSILTYQWIFELFYYRRFETHSLKFQNRGQLFFYGQSREMKMICPQGELIFTRVAPSKWQFTGYCSWRRSWMDLNCF